MSKKIPAMKWTILIFCILFLGACTSDSSTTKKEMEEVTPTENLNKEVVEKTIEPAVQEEKENVTTKKKPVRLGTAPVRLAMQEKIEKMHEDLMKQVDIGLDAKDVNKYAKESELYISIYGDSLAAEYIFNAADMYRGLGENKKALEMWYLVYKNYQHKHPKAPHAMFQCGFTYDSILNRKDLAKTLYTMFLNTYPNHELADDAKNLLKNLNKSPEDLIKEFQKKNQN